MKTQIAILSLFAVPFFAHAAAVPDGTLGVNNLRSYGTYEGFKVKDAGTYDFAGAGIGINQNVFGNEGYGVDVGLEYSYLESTDSDVSYVGRYWVAKATVYKKGTFAPFVSALVEVDHETSEYGYSEDSTYFGGVFGVECHLLPGWYVTPSFAYAKSIDSDGYDDYTTLSLATGYWVTEKFDVLAEVGNSDYDGDKATVISLGLAYHY
jgi:hypothetical protein